jgi:hypothetical protein
MMAASREAGALALEVVVPFFKSFKELVRTFSKKVWTILKILTEAPRKIKVIQLTTISVSSVL